MGECTACGVGCGGGGPGSGAMSYVGTGQGEYIQETTYRYMGAGGDFDNVRPRRDFTCIITSCCLLSLLLLLPLLCWLLSGTASTLPYDCDAGFSMWGPPLRHTIVMPDSQIGWQDGQQPRKRGAAKMLGRDALQQPVGVLRPDLVGRLDQGAGVCAPSSGAWELSSVFLWEVWHRFAWHSCSAGAFAIFWCWACHVSLSQNCSVSCIK